MCHILTDIDLFDTFRCGTQIPSGHAGISQGDRMGVFVQGMIPLQDRVTAIIEIEEVVQVGQRLFVVRAGAEPIIVQRSGDRDQPRVMRRDRVGGQDAARQLATTDQMHGTGRDPRSETVSQQAHPLVFGQMSQQPAQAITGRLGAFGFLAHVSQLTANLLAGPRPNHESHRGRFAGSAHQDLIDLPTLGNHRRAGHAITMDKNDGDLVRGRGLAEFVQLRCLPANAGSVPLQSQVRVFAGCHTAHVSG